MRVDHGLRAALVVAIVVLFAHVPVRVSAATPYPLKVGVGSDSITMTPLYFAERLGFFRAENLVIEFVPLPTAALMIAPLGTGQLDVGGGAIAAGLYNAVARGIDLRIVADLGSDPPGYGFQTLVVRNSLIASGGFKTLRDLKGKRLAITARGISTSAMVAAFLRHAGLSESDVTMLYMSVPDQIAAMRNGALDASLMPEPGPSIAEKAGVATKVLHDDAYYPNQALVALFFGTSLVSAHRDVGLRFMRAYLRGVRVYNDNLRNGHIAGPQAEPIMSIFSEQTHQERDVLNVVVPSGDNPNGRLNLPSLAADYAYFKASGLIENPSANYLHAVDPWFANEAVKQLGPYRR